jgi:predicted phosphoribosyltransferase
MAVPFQNRSEAGRVLAGKLTGYRNREDVLVLALPRGGVPVGFEIAHALSADLDIFLVRKLGLPGQEELAVGAIASGGVRVLNHGLLETLHLSPAVLESVATRELRELERRESLYREGRPATPVRDRTIILVDDGLATGASMLAAVRALRPQGPRRIVVAVPVAAEAACDDFLREVDEVVCAATPEPFRAVGIWYEDFSQTTDEEVQELLERAARERVS